MDAHAQSLRFPEFLESGGVLERGRDSGENLHRARAVASSVSAQRPRPRAWLTLPPALSIQYLLSPETIEALRKPTFDVWLWEPNEVSEGPSPIPSPLNLMSVSLSPFPLPFSSLFFLVFQA